MKKQTTITIPVFILAIILSVSGFIFGVKNAKVKQYSLQVGVDAKTPTLPKATNKPTTQVSTSSQVKSVNSVVPPVTTAPVKKIISAPSVIKSAPPAKAPVVKPVVQPAPPVSAPVTPPTPTTSASPARP